MHRLIDCRHCAAQILFCRIAMPRILYYTFENMVLPSGTHPSKTMIEHKNAIVRFLKCRIQVLRFYIFNFLIFEFFSFYDPTH